MKTEDAAQQAASSSILRHLLLGFHPASLEERFQQEQVKAAKATDLVAALFWTVVSSILAWGLLHPPNFPGGDLLSHQVSITAVSVQQYERVSLFEHCAGAGVIWRCIWVWLAALQPLLLTCLWLVLVLCPNLRRATRWRPALIAATRLHAVTGRLLGEAFFIHRYLNGEGLVRTRFELVQTPSVSLKKTHR